MELFRQEYWSELPFPSPGDLPDPGIEHTSSAQAGGFFTIELPGKSINIAVLRLSLAVLSSGYSSLRCLGFSLWWLLLLQSTDSRA